MQDLTVTGVEDGSLLVASPDGSRYRIAIDDTFTAALRQASPLTRTERKLAPREIQAHIRSGMSAEDVAAISGADLDYIRRFEGPVLAEREFIVEQALNVAVHTAMDIDPMSGGSTFGSVIRDRLQDLGASGERWASWKELEGGWVVKLEFEANEIAHDARWRYEPKKSVLAPINGEAHTLSQQGEMPGGLIPRLRAVGDDRSADTGRFDSGAFDLRSSGEQARDAGHGDPVPFGRSGASSPEVAAAAIKRSPAPEIESSQTADLLDALRRRRGEREAASAWDDDAVGDDARSSHPSAFRGEQESSAPDAGANRFRLIDVPLPTFDDGEGRTIPQAGAPKAQARKGRSAMPSWDEIVFGARSDDDLA